MRSVVFRRRAASASHRSPAEIFRGITASVAHGPLQFPETVPARYHELAAVAFGAGKQELTSDQQ